MACMHGYVLRNCPASVYQSSLFIILFILLTKYSTEKKTIIFISATECNSFKDFVTACPNPPIRLG